MENVDNTPITKRRLLAILRRFDNEFVTTNILGVTGSGTTWEIEIAPGAGLFITSLLEAKGAANLSGYQSGYGSWFMRQNYTTRAADDYDYSNPASSMHY